MVTRLNIGLNTAVYEPGQVPQNSAQIPGYLQQEFRKIAGCIALLQAGHLDITYVAPEKPRDGDIRIADGTLWNPLGTGLKKPVWYDATAAAWKAF